MEHPFSYSNVQLASTRSPQVNLNITLAKSFPNSSPQQ